MLAAGIWVTAVGIRPGCCSLLGLIAVPAWPLHHSLSVPPHYQHQHTQPSSDHPERGLLLYVTSESLLTLPWQPGLGPMGRERNHLHPSMPVHALCLTPLHPKVVSKIDFQLAQMFKSQLVSQLVLVHSPRDSTYYSITSELSRNLSSMLPKETTPCLEELMFLPSHPR